jgi:hypothetical protein
VIQVNKYIESPGKEKLVLKLIIFLSPIIHYIFSVNSLTHYLYHMSIYLGIE